MVLFDKMTANHESIVHSARDAAYFWGSEVTWTLINLHHGISSSQSCGRKPDFPLDEFISSGNWVALFYEWTSKKIEKSFLALITLFTPAEDFINSI